MVSNSPPSPRKHLRQVSLSQSSVALPLSPSHTGSSMLIDGRSESPWAGKVHTRRPTQEKPTKQGLRTSYA